VLGWISTACRRPTSEPTGYERQVNRRPRLWEMVLSWLLPATMSRRMAGVSLGRAYVIHWISGLLTTGLILVFVAWSEDLYRDGQRGFPTEFASVVHEVIREFDRDPLSALLVTAGIVAGVEVAFVWWAFLVTPWGARDEKMIASIGNALRRTWLHTTYALPATLLIGLCTVEVQQLQRENMAACPVFTPPQPPVGVSADSQEWKDYQAVQARLATEYRIASEQYLRLRAWYVRHGEELIAYLCFAVAAWFLWTLFRSAAADRPTVPPERPPLCEFCGYNLTSAPMEGRCPECGEYVTASLGPEARLGTPWDRRREVGRRRAWWSCSRQAILRPTEFCRQIQLTTGAAGYRSFLGTYIPLVFAAAFLGVILCYLADVRRSPLGHDTEVVFAVAPLAGYMTVAGLGCLGLCTAWLAALHCRLADGRNLLSGTVQVFAYTSWYLLLWAVLAAVLGAGMFACKSFFHELAAFVQINRRTVTFVIWLAPNAICAVLYVRLIFRGTEGLRFANR
jgi:hypothetical protein